MWTTTEQVERELSSKWRVLFDIVKSILKNDDGPFPYVDENHRIQFPEVVELPDQTKKIVIYVDFVKTVPHMLKVRDGSFVQSFG